MAVTNRSALLVGCNYFSNPKGENNSLLHGCINDVKAMQALIGHRFGFENITILTDDDGETERQPTSLNIKVELTKLIDAAKSGDTLLFYFSGGGSSVKPPVNPAVQNEIKMGIPAIIPCDFKPITGKKILDIIKPLPATAIFTFICDSSYSGGLFDENVQIEFNVPDYGHNFRRKTIHSDVFPPSDVSGKSAAGISLNNKILISSSRANEESVEAYPNGNKPKPFGAFSNAIQTLLNSPEAVNAAVARNDLRARNTNMEVAEFTRGMLGILPFDQHPYLNCSEHNAAAPFLGNVVLDHHDQEEEEEAQDFDGGPLVTHENRHDRAALEARMARIEENQAYLKKKCKKMSRTLKALLCCMKDKGAPPPSPESGD